MLPDLGSTDDGASSWIRLLFSPALVFWVVGGAIVVASADGGFQALESWVAHRPPPVQGALAVGAVLLILMSGLIVEPLIDPVLQFLEGYHWPPVLDSVRRWLVERCERKRRNDAKRFQELQGVAPADLAPEQQKELTTLDVRLRQTPLIGRPCMPSRVGNVLAAAEAQPYDKYGLDPWVCWPRLWLLLPESSKTEVLEARSSLDSAAGTMMWSLAFVAWSWWAWWCAPIGLLLASLIYRIWVVRAAGRFGTIVEVCFDVHRLLLYESLHWPAPRTPADERERQGRDLTRYLFRGDAPATLRYTGSDGEASPPGGKGTTAPRSPEPLRMPAKREP